MPDQGKSDPYPPSMTVDEEIRAYRQRLSELTADGRMTTQEAKYKLSREENDRMVDINIYEANKKREQERGNDARGEAEHQPKEHEEPERDSSDRSEQARNANDPKFDHADPDHPSRADATQRPTEPDLKNDRAAEEPHPERPSQQSQPQRVNGATYGAGMEAQQTAAWARVKERYAQRLEQSNERDENASPDQSSDRNSSNREEGGPSKDSERSPSSFKDRNPPDLGHSR